MSVLHISVYYKWRQKERNFSFSTQIPPCPISKTHQNLSLYEISKEDILGYSCAGGTSEELLLADGSSPSRSRFWEGDFHLK